MRQPKRSAIKPGTQRADTSAREDAGLMRGQRPTPHRGAMPVADERGAAGKVRRFAQRNETAHRDQQRKGGRERT